MPNSGMGNAYNLTSDTIERIVPSVVGAYMLGSFRDNIFYVSYVGRSDIDLQKRLLQHLGEGYTHFKFQTITSMYNAYKKECELYHMFNNLHNLSHPDKSEGTDYTCPVCGQ